MLHPSYTEIMEKINTEAEAGANSAIDSRYSIVIATSKRAREIIDGQKALVPTKEDEKPLSTAVKELYASKLQILPEALVEDDSLTFEGETDGEEE